MAFIGQESALSNSTGDDVFLSRSLDDSNNFPVREDDYIELIRRLRSQLDSKTSECEVLKIKLDQTNHEVETLSQQLDSFRLNIHISNEDIKRTHDEVLKSKKLEEDYLKLMSDYLDLGEQTNLYKQNLIENYLAKSNAINNYECLMSSGALTHELSELKSDLHQRQADMNLATAKIRNLEEENLTKEKNIQELKKTIDDAKITHKHEVTVLEEYIQCLKNTITSYEKTLLSYIESKA